MGPERKAGKHDEATPLASPCRMAGRRRSPWRLMGAPLLALAMVAGSTVTAPADADAEVSIRTPHSGRRPLQLDIHAGFSYWDLGVASGVRFGIPIVRNGFVRSINNAVYINFGLDFYWARWGHDYYPALGIPITLHWEFYFTDRWSAFAELGVNIYFHPRFFHDNHFEWSPGHWVAFAVGGRFFITPNVALTLRVGNPYASFGISFLF